MAEQGILDADDRVELLDGKIVEMSPISKQHLAFVNRLARLLFQLLQEQAILSVQSPVRLGPDSEPEPDISVLKWKENDYYDGIPGPEDILLVVEVAYSSQEKDREVKGPLYAQAGVAEFWLIDAEKNRLEQYTHPSSSGYTGKKVWLGNQKILLPGFDLRLDLSRLWFTDFPAG